MRVPERAQDYGCPFWSCPAGSPSSQGAGIRGTSTRLLSSRASLTRSRSVMFMRARQRTRRSFVRLIPVVYVSGLDHALGVERDETHMWKWYFDPRPGRGYPSGGGRPAVRTGTRGIPRTASRIRLESSPGQKAPSWQRYDSANIVLVFTTNHIMRKTKTHKLQCAVVNQLVKERRRSCILSRKPCLDQSRTVMALDEVVLEPRQS